MTAWCGLNGIYKDTAHECKLNVALCDCGKMENATKAVARAMSPAKQRAARIAQAKHRGTANSHKTVLENVLLLLAWEAEVLSEGQVSRLLDLDRVSVRQMRLDLLDRATALADALYGKAPPQSEDDQTHE